MKSLYTGTCMLGFFLSSTAPSIISMAEQYVDLTGISFTFIKNFNKCFFFQFQNFLFGVYFNSATAAVTLKYCFTQILERKDKKAKLFERLLQNKYHYFHKTCYEGKYQIVAKVCYILLHFNLPNLL